MRKNHLKRLVVDGIEWTLYRENDYYWTLIGGVRVYLHRYIWEQKYGRIRRGCVVHHIDHNKHNNDISNLQMVTIKQHRRLHNAHLINRDKQEFVCVTCGVKYMSLNQGTNRFCSEKCCADWKRKNVLEPRFCSVCDKIFMIYKFAHTKTCSPVCARQSRSRSLAAR